MSHQPGLKSFIPNCFKCGKPITFYMHQQTDPDEGMRYFHPECCPECPRRPT